MSKPKTPEVPPDFEEIGQQFKREVCSLSDAKELQELNWFDLSVGWAIAKGHPPEKAYSFASWVRYVKEYYQ